MTPRARQLYATLFFFSGVAGLVYEVCWTRLLRLPMGNTIYSITAVLAAFMGGLALGAWLAGRRIGRNRNPLRVYAILEAGIGLFCLVLPWIVRAEEPFFRMVYRSFGNSFLAYHLLKFAACGLVVLVPATLMGATLPILCRSFVDDPRRIGASIATLYAVNGFGAACGALLAGFVLVPGIGLRSAMLVGVATSLGVAALAWRAAAGRSGPATDRRRGEAAKPTQGRPGAPPRGDRVVDRSHAALQPLTGAVRIVLLVGYGLSGLAAMVFQVAWTRALSLAFGSSVYAFALLVAAFILGLVAGSAVAGRLADRTRRPALGFVAAELGVGFTALAIVPLLERFPEWMLGIVPSTAQNFTTFQLVQFAMVFAAILLPTACMGACLPFVGRALTAGVDRASEAVGTAYASNALGTILGAFLGGFVLLPALGVDGAIAAGAGLVLGFGSLLLVLVLPRRRGVPAAAAVVAASILALVFVPKMDPSVLTSGAHLYAAGMRQNLRPGEGLRQYMRREYETLLQEDGAAATLTVRENTAGVRSLVVNGKVDASDDTDQVTQRLIGHLPCLLHRQPRDVAVVGLASGMTVGSVACYSSVRAFDCIEIQPEMAAACRLFDHANGRVLDDPRLRLVIEDGRNHVAFTDRQYDVIVSEPTNPWIAGVASLFTREYFAACRARLRPGGIMCFWMQMYGSDLHILQSGARTFLEVFPEASMWESIFGADYVFVGSADGLAVKWEDLAERMQEPRVGADLARLGMRGPVDLLVHHLADGAALRAWAEPGEVYRDDSSRLEFEAPRLLHRPTTRGDMEGVRALSRPVLPGWLKLPVAGLPDSSRTALQAAYSARDLFWQGFQRRLGGDAPGALRLFLEAQVRNRHLVGSVPSYLLDVAQPVANQALAAGDTATAVRIFETIAARNPEVAELQAALGAVLVTVRRYAAAEHALRATLELRPRDAESRLQLAVALDLQGRREAAEDEVRRVVEIHPHDATARLSLANFLVERGELRPAEEQYRVALDVDPGDADAWYLLGNVLSMQGSGRDAARALERAVKLEPGMARGNTLLAQVYAGLGERDKAARAAARAGSGAAPAGR